MILERFDGRYENLPAARFDTAQEYETFRRQLVQAGYSFKTKVVPPKGDRQGRKIVIMLLSTRKTDGA